MFSIHPAFRRASLMETKGSLFSGKVFLFSLSAGEGRRALARSLQRQDYHSIGRRAVVTCVSGAVTIP